MVVVEVYSRAVGVFDGVRISLPSTRNKRLRAVTSPHLNLRSLVSCVYIHSLFFLFSLYTHRRFFFRFRNAEYKAKDFVVMATLNGGERTRIPSVWKRVIESLTPTSLTSDDLVITIKDSSYKDIQGILGIYTEERNCRKRFLDSFTAG
jgi:hypothetical protein